MEKSFEIKNHTTFKASIEKLLENTSITKLEQKSGLSKGCLNKYLNGKSKKLSSENIEKILTAFNWNPNDVGVKVIPKTKFSIRLETLLKENNIAQKTLATDLGVATGTVSSWINGRNEPTLTLAKEIAKKFNVHYLYLLGEIDTRTVYNSTINEMIGLQDETINNISVCYNMNIYGKNQHDNIYKDFGFRYIDIVDFVASNLQFFNIFYLEAARVMTYYAGGNFRSDFNKLFNTVELELTPDELGIDENVNFGASDYPTPYNVSIETCSKAILCEKLKRMFDEFIDKKLKEKNITKE